MSSAAPVESTTRPRSPAQIEASRRNGARSHGPIGPEAKARASRNALRHGLCSTRSLAPGEDPEAFEALLADLHREAAPRTRLEALLLERLALTFWKLARCDRLEATLATIEPHCPTGRLFPDPGLPRILSRVPELSLLLRYQGQLGRDLQRLLKLVMDPLLDRLAETAPEASAEEDAPAPAEAAGPPPAAPRNEPEPAPPRSAKSTAAAPGPGPTGPRDVGTAPPEPPMRNEPEPSLGAIGPAPRGEPGRASDGWPPAPAAFPPRTDTTRAAAGPPTPATPLARAEPPPTPDRLADLRGQLPWAR
mgnify:FL=1